MKKVWQLVSENKGLVFHVIKKEFWWFRNIVLGKDDLFQYGLLGLHNAVLKFNKERKIKFSTYAYISIRNTIQRAIENEGYGACRIPSYLYRVLNKFNETECKNTSQMIQAGFRALKSVNKTESNELEINSISVSRRDHEQLKAGMIIHEALPYLTTREQLVLKERFGLSGCISKSLKKVGKRLHLSGSRIQQIERKAIDKLRSKFKNGKTPH